MELFLKNWVNPLRPTNPLPGDLRLIEGVLEIYDEEYLGGPLGWFTATFPEE